MRAMRATKAASVPVKSSPPCSHLDTAGPSQTAAFLVEDENLSRLYNSADGTELQNMPDPDVMDAGQHLDDCTASTSAPLPRWFVQDADMISVQFGPSPASRGKVRQMHMYN